MELTPAHCGPVDEMIEIGPIARVCHEANRAWCAAHGDMSQMPWDEAPNWQKQSCIDGVSFVLSFPDAGDHAQHDNWLKFKAAEGWAYGAAKDPAVKTHPCMVPFDCLPPIQQAKDRMFRAIVLALRATP